MKKLIPVFILFIFCVENANAQSGEWTWMGGDTTYNNIGYAVGFGIADSLNKPGATYEAACWTDTAGNFWMFGGAFFTYNEGNPVCNSEMWKYDPKTNLWTYVRPSGDFYGKRKIPDTLNCPPPRFGSATWTDANGDLWLFGGLYGAAFAVYGYFNDVWKYNIATNLWTWMGGSNQANERGIYGAKGVTNDTNIISGRALCTGWRRKDGNIYIFGGTDGNIYYNDLWKYDVTKNKWTWIKGDDTYVSWYVSSLDTTSAGHYGTLGVADPANAPRGRQCTCQWQDSSGNLYFYGGYSVSNKYPPYLSDIWKYDTSNNWIWIAGKDTIDFYASGAKMCAPSVENISPSRDQPSHWVNKDGTFGFFGGTVMKTLYNPTSTKDVWKFDPLNLEWTALLGSEDYQDVSYSYGIKGISSLRNMIPPRKGAAQWMDGAGNIWIFGGQPDLYETNNDLWRYSPDSSCIITTAIQHIRESKNIVVYPNPATNNITVSFPFSNNTLIISDLFGRTVKQEKIANGNSSTINIHDLAQGIYFVSVRDEQGKSIASDKLLKE